MICRFCSQWNPDGELRCCFCGNHREASEDLTLAGRPAYTQQMEVRLPRPAASSTGPSLIRTGQGLLEQVREAGGPIAWMRGLDREQRVCLVASLVVLLSLIVMVLCC